MDPLVRWVNQYDLKHLVEMENLAFGGERCRWTENAYVNMLRRKNHVGVVLTLGADIVVGVMVYELMSDGMRLHRLVVHSDYREMGFARRLLEKLCSKLSGRRQKVLCDVPEDRLEMQLLLKSCGWLATGLGNGAIRFELTRERLTDLATVDTEEDRSRRRLVGRDD